MPLPPGVTFDPGTRTLTGLPTRAGSFVATYTVTDRDGDEDSQTFTFTISADNLAPSFAVSALTLTPAIGVRFEQQLPAAMGGNLPVRYDIQSGSVSGLSFNENTRTLSGIPSQIGTTTLTYRARDIDDDEATITITVSVGAKPSTLWTEPRDWEGFSEHGDDADRLGEKVEENRYSFNDELSNQLQETMPGKAENPGSIFVAMGPNLISEVLLGADGTVLHVDGSNVEFVIPEVLHETIWPVTHYHDLVQGGEDGTPQRLAGRFRLGKGYLTSGGPGELAGWE